MQMFKSLRSICCKRVKLQSLIKLIRSREIASVYALRIVKSAFIIWSRLEASHKSFFLN